MLLYHYCSNAAFQSIVEHRELWATELSLSNDRYEGTWIRKVFAEVCEADASAKTYAAQIFNCMDTILTSVGAAGVCLSADGDLLSQWRGYADDGNGVSIGFEKEYLASLHRPAISLTKVIYEEAEQKEYLAHFLKNVLPTADRAFRAQTDRPEDPNFHLNLSARAHRTLNRSFFQQGGCIYKFKNPAFHEEKEWRLLFHWIDHDGQSPHGSPQYMSFLAKRDRIVPYIKIGLSGEHPITRIILGPKNITPVSVVEAFLLKNGMPSVRVDTSAASYR